MPLQKRFGMEISMKNKISRRKLENGIFSSIVIIAAIIIVILVNFIVENKLNITKDFSQGKIYSISEQSENILKNLNEEVQIYLMASTGKEDAGIVRLLGEYQKVTENIVVDTVDPVNNPTLVNQYSAGTASENSLIFVGSKRSKVVDYNEIYLTDSSTYYETGEITKVFDGEGVITSAIDFVTTDDLPTLYIVEGHDEIALDDLLISSIERQNIKVQYLNLVNTSIEIPEDAKCLLINSPAKDYTEKQVEMISTYIDEGGNALIISDYTNEDLTNFKDLLNHYGLSVKDGIVMESDGANHIVDYPYYLLPTISTHDITKPLIDASMRILMPGAQAIEISDEKDMVLDYSPLLITSSNAYIKTDAIDTDDYSQGLSDEKGLFTLAVAGESENSKLVYATTSAMLNADYSDYVSGANWDLTINCISWMCEHESGIDIHIKDLDSTQTIVVDSQQVKTWSIIMAGIIPALVIIIGILVCVERRKGGK